MMKSKQLHLLKIVCISVGLVFTLSQIGCSSEQSSSLQEETKPITVGLLICMSEDTPFFISLVEGAREASERYGIELIILYAHDDPELQGNQMKELTRQGVSAIILNPVSDSVHPYVEEVAGRGIPIFTIDRSLACTCIVSHIASNNFDGGRMAGVYMAEVLNRKGNIVELRGTPGSSAAIERGQGFHQAISEYPGINVVTSVSANFNRQDGKKLFEEVLAQYSDIDAVFAHNDDMILGAIESAKQAGRLNEIYFVGFDGIEEAIDALEDGELLATIAQRPKEMGKIGVETVIAYLSGKDISDTIFIDLALILK
ncbi:MAG: D-ribose ABC transporter substrate-binding protein [bacterium]